MRRGSARLRRLERQLSFRAERGDPHRDSEQLLDWLYQFLRLGPRRVARHRSAIAVDQEFGEIPFDDRCSENAGLVVFEMAIERVGLAAIDLQPGKHRKSDPEILAAEAGDL